MTEVWSWDQLRDFMREQEFSQQAVEVVGRWPAGGRGAAVYKNALIEAPVVKKGVVVNPQLDCKIVSFGPAGAQLETTEPPTRLPDIGGQINWRYQLHAVVRPQRVGEVA